MKDILKREMESWLSGGLYHRIQIELTYNSKHIENSRLTHDQTRYIYETNTIRFTEQATNVDDIIETTNHFWCIDFIIANADRRLTEKDIIGFHAVFERIHPFQDGKGRVGKLIMSRNA